uniref:Uncharacterized protein n=1 Tax=Poecilia latipinna TaxID=48699 RepID=A0A3B3VRH3_9TELE
MKQVHVKKNPAFFCCNLHTHTQKKSIQAKKLRMLHVTVSETSLRSQSLRLINTRHGQKCKASSRQRKWTGGRKHNTYDREQGLEMFEGCDMDDDR